MAEITTAGYQTLRDFVSNNWGYIEVYDDTGAAVTRVSISGDSRCQWLDIDGDNVLKVEFVITGNDSDITQPVTLNASALWDDTSANNGVQCTPNEQFAQATLNQDGDTVTVTHTVKIPQ